MKTVNVGVKIPQKSSRVELLVRLIYWIPLGIVFWVLTAVGFLCWIVNLLSVLIKGRVSVSLAQVQKAAVDYEYKLKAYYSFLTDERPPILPESEK